MSPFYLLDTTVLLHWTRGKSQADTLERQFLLSESPLRPLVCEVSLGELLAFSRMRQWSERQRERMQTIEQHVTSVDISDRRVLEAYADISTLAQASRQDGSAADNPSTYNISRHGSSAISSRHS